MGLSASQARFLGLTARKSNVEYQGQQINQARTALANEVNGLFDKYNSLKVPTPPAQADYTKTTFNVDSADKNYSIANYEKITDPSNPYYGYYTLTMDYDDDVAQVYPYSARNSIIEANDDYTDVKFNIGTDSYYYKEGDENSNIIKIDTGDSEFDITKYAGLEYVMQYDKKELGEIYFMYVKDGVNYYTSQADLDETFKSSSQRTYNGTYLFEYQGTKSVQKQTTAIGTISQGKDGRLSSISILDCEEDKTLIGTTHDIDISTYQDEIGYNDAMNQYQYAKQKYEYEVEKINKKTAKIQQEDRALELKLNQLQTEQKALATEQDSVKKVIEDTINSVFKTYNG